jgi:hypothetical protein
MGIVGIDFVGGKNLMEEVLEVKGDREACATEVTAD